MLIPTLLLPIPHVVSMGSKKKMLRVNAFRVIASMQNVHSIWNFPTKHLEENTMSLLETTTNLDGSISIAI